MRRILFAICLFLLVTPCYAADVIELQNSVIDQSTGLIWQRGYSQQKLTWQQATDYCSALSLDGYADWRLPTRAEAVSIMDFDAFNPAATIPLNFSTTAPDMYFPFWTETPQAGDNSRAWAVGYFTGSAHHNPKKSTYFARCVTGTSNVGTVLIEKQGGVAIDKKNKLTWEQSPYMGIVTQAGAAAYCSRLNLKGRGWRLPTMAELATIIDDTRNPATMYPLRDNYAQTWTGSDYPDYCDIWGYCMSGYVRVITSSGCFGVEKKKQTYWELKDNAPNYHTYTRCVRDGISSNSTRRW